MGDAILGRAERAIVWAYVVSFPGEEVFEFAGSGIRAALGSDAKEAQACIIVWGGECGGCYSYTVLGPQGKESAGGRGMGRVCWVKV